MACLSGGNFKKEPPRAICAQGTDRADIQESGCAARVRQRGVNYRR